MHDKWSSWNSLACTKTPTFPTLRFWIDISILMFLKFPVLAKLSTFTCFFITFSWYHSIQTSLTTVIWYICMLYRWVNIAFRNAEARLHLIIFRDLPLSVQINILLDWSKVFKTFSKLVQALLIVFEHAYYLHYQKIIKKMCLEKHI